MSKEEFFKAAKAYMDKQVASSYELSAALSALSKGAFPVIKDPENIQSFYRVASCGGVSGGSCWDSSNPKPYSSEIPDPGIGPALDDFLEEHFPDIRLLAYRRLVRAVREHEYTEREYYGNCTDYKVWELTFEDAWAVLEDA